LAQIYCQQSARQPGDIISERRATSSRNRRATSSESALKGGFHEHALADAWPVCCDVKPITDTFAKPNRHLATRGGFAFARRSNVNAISLPIQFG
jgi:hypothetical protein